MSPGSSSRQRATMTEQDFNIYLHALSAPERNTLLSCTLKSLLPNRVYIDEDYEIPWQLAVTPASRPEVAHAFYANTTFGFNNSQHVEQWLASLSPLHRALVSDLRSLRPIAFRAEADFDDDAGLDNSGNKFQYDWHWKQYDRDFDWWTQDHIKVATTVIKRKIRVDKADGSYTTEWIDLCRHYWLFQVSRSGILSPDRERDLYGVPPQQGDVEFRLVDKDSGVVVRKS